ncbi:MAG: urea ABC transporter permease subunit UrtB [Deltaproteobacteria bacterium]|nr:urea ABC transporter permease subunit UrtB [Deltaproteobacteria bacterium]
MTHFFVLFLFSFWTLCSITSPATPARADDSPSPLQGLAATSLAEVEHTLAEIGLRNEVSSLPVLEAFRDRRLRVDESGTLYIVSEDGASVREAVSGAAATVAIDQLRTPVVSNMIRRTLLPVIAQLQLQSADPAVRLAAAEELNKRPRPEAIEPIRTALAKETDTRVRTILEVALAQMQLSSPEPKVRLEAIAMIRAAGNLGLKSQLEALLGKRDDGSFTEPDAAVRQAVTDTLASFERSQFWISTVGNLFYGLSLGSILLLAALGLAITFGLMGVINMAHGEMLMIGAYVTYVSQRVFQAYVPTSFDYYLLAAIPAAFLVCAAVGMLMERSVIRFLYGRPLETLLATWGISLVLIQSVRLLFGAQNVEVANPSWLSGGVEVLYGIVLPYSRLAIIMFVVLVVIAVWLLLQRTRLGLYVRAVTQNRSMAACMGVATARIDMWTFGLGSGLAGLGGVALSQIGNVGPELGQSYIIDSFMVVVLGGVGNIAGTVLGGLGLGLINKLLEPMAGAVLGKIGVLIFIVLFIQRRPQGLFALKGRMAEG